MAAMAASVMAAIAVFLTALAVWRHMKNARRDETNGGRRVYGAKKNDRAVREDTRVNISVECATDSGEGVTSGGRLKCSLKKFWRCSAPKEWSQA
eukprot:6200037-Pleurochrysis_carterae.AAC.2